MSSSYPNKRPHPMKRGSSSSGRIATEKSEKIVHDYLSTDLTFKDIALKHKVPLSTVSNIVCLYETDAKKKEQPKLTQVIEEELTKNPQYWLKNTNYKLVWHMSIQKAQACKHSLSIKLQNKENNNNIEIPSHQKCE